MRILIGILHSQEPQKDECVKSIENQQYSFDYDYFIISGLSKRDAHDTLYSKFMSESSNYDLFVKLDADMIIERQDFFQFLYSVFQKDTKLDWMRLLIHDHFLDQNISGLNIYRFSVKWAKNVNNCFTDRVMIKSSVRKDIGLDPSTIWITHCKDASIYQAFNFGFHRAIKAFQFNSKKRIYSTLQWNAFLRVFKLYKIDRSKQNLIIIASLVYVIIHRVGDLAINENNKEKKDAFLFLSNLSLDDLENYVEQSSVLNYLKLGKIGFYLIRLKFYILEKLS